MSEFQAIASRRIVELKTKRDQLDAVIAELEWLVAREQNAGNLQAPTPSLRSPGPTSPVVRRSSAEYPRLDVAGLSELVTLPLWSVGRRLEELGLEAKA